MPDAKAKKDEKRGAPEGGPERVHIGQRARIVLRVHLPGHGEVRGLGKEVSCVIDAAVRQPLDAPHRPRPAGELFKGQEQGFITADR